MSAPQPDNPPLDDGECRAWAQMHELSSEVQQLHTPETWCSILALASDILWAASGRRWRNVEATETVTLDGPECGCLPLPSGYVPNWGWGYRLPVSWTSSNPTRVRLPRPDVTAITAVTINGNPVTAYRRAGNWAIRTDGCGWPLGADRTRITYTFGRLIPSSANLAALALAAELGKWLAAKPCSLPARVTSVTRQGVSFDMLEALEYLKDGLTGVPVVDLWLKSVNPDNRKRSGQVWSPDQTWARSV